MSFLPELGERALIVGSTGSGKTAFATFMLRRFPESPVIIYDGKGDDKFLTLPNSVAVYSMEEVVDAVNNIEVDYVVFRPPVSVINKPELLDEMLLFHYNNFPNVAAYIDEIYIFQRGAIAGDGLAALLTRGRSRGITTIVSTQRPAFLSRFCISEAQKFYVFTLNMQSDRKRVADFIPDFDGLSEPRKFGFWFYRVGAGAPLKYNPVKLDPGIDKVYVPVQPVVEPIEGPETVQQNPRRKIWI